MKVSTTVTLSKDEVLSAIATYLENNDVDIPNDSKVDSDDIAPHTVVTVTSGADTPTRRRRRRTKEQIAADKARQAQREEEEQQELDIPDPEDTASEPTQNEPEEVREVVNDNPFAKETTPSPLSKIFQSKDELG